MPFVLLLGLLLGAEPNSFLTPISRGDYTVLPYDKKIARLNTQIDSKLRSKIEQKKAAHGLKTDRDVRQDMDDEDYGIRM